MERVGVLIDKLQKQYQQKADVQNLLVTVQLLHNELLLNTNNVEDDGPKKVSVVVPNAKTVSVDSLLHVEAAHSAYKPVPKPESEPAPVAEPIPDPEAPMPEPAPLPTPKPEPEPIPDPGAPMPEPGPLPTPKPEPEPNPHFGEPNPWLTVFPQKGEKKNVWSL